MKSQNPSTNPLLLSAKFIAKDVVGDLLYWPVWWYSAGLVLFIKKRWSSIKSFEAATGLTVWIVNWFKPMYGQEDFWGRLFSFIMRTAMIIGKGTKLILYTILQIVMLAVWVIFPLVAVWQLAKSIF